jgi:hypothetical protein
LEDNHCALPSRTRGFILRCCRTDVRSNSAAIEGNFSKLYGAGGEICCRGGRTRQYFALGPLLGWNRWATLRHSYESTRQFLRKIGDG